MNVILSRGLSYGYRSEPAVDAVDFEIRTGEWLGIVGPNGSGKSTVLRMLARLVKPHGGSVLLDGADLASLNPKETARKLSMLAQNQDASLDITVRELVKKGRHPHLKWFQDGSSSSHEEIVDWAIAAASLQELQHRPLPALSGGERQRAWLAMALCQTPDILLLDEPGTYLDIAHQLELMELVRKLNKERGTTVVMVLHDLNQAARYCDRLLAVKKGKIAAEGTPGELFREEFFRDVFGVSGRIRSEDGIPSFQPVRTVRQEA
ncbi:MULTISPECIES: ABC transporter ATP-binding protein [unclassified Paenibacillus]|uniref:ABC transporter ATP-binding protein n=1 Tax=unclassified Paenibacillus TaxID=185978 RepID=UPI000956CAFD|nr:MULTISPECIES: ABC transporter ATP-binding protein [unclassified Paenibacillus]ASS64848.1 ABC transporter ATP-binding protein [Paenibacillus sp. RUD330]SIR03920.1 iron complex transport system ATP-binding protein [Paenibacillus sp. RU4X]SIR31318.1 iron complex transport system ATP-binding protein [Paenibacillus sp. RU4T]